MRYGLFWWRWPQEDPRIGPVHFANGIKGQRIYVLPKHGIIIAVSANISDADAQQATLRWFAPLFRPCRAMDRSISQLLMPTGLRKSCACHSPASLGTL